MLAYLWVGVQFTRLVVSTSELVGSRFTKLEVSHALLASVKTDLYET